MIVTAGWEAVLFDLDGVLVDSMPTHHESYRDVLAPYGVDLTYTDFLQQSVGPASSTIPQLLGRDVEEADLRRLHAEKVSAFRARLETHGLPRLPLCDLVPLLAGRVPMALVTSASRPTVEAIDRHIGRLRYFDVVVTGEDVHHGKPAPEPYLMASDRLGVPPRGCLVFEDSPGGIESARGAGMHVVEVAPSGSGGAS